MRFYQKIKTLIAQDERFLHGLKFVEITVSKILSVGMILVTFIAIYHLGYALTDKIINTVTLYNYDKFNATLFELFGLFLNVLIALEILENISAYLKKQVVQAELVVVTSLIAVARKIIILDLEKKDSNDLIALAIAVFSLSLSYVILRVVNKKN
jgi:uncharacterized membrane protein (DUF373 family)